MKPDDCTDLKTVDLRFESPTSAKNVGVCVLITSARIEATKSPGLGLSYEVWNFEGETPSRQRRKGNCKITCKLLEKMTKMAKRKLMIWVKNSS